MIVQREGRRKRCMGFGLILGLVGKVEVRLEQTARSATNGNSVLPRRGLLRLGLLPPSLQDVKRLLIRHVIPSSPDLGGAEEGGISTSTSSSGDWIICLATRWRTTGAATKVLPTSLVVAEFDSGSSQYCFASAVLPLLNSVRVEQSLLDYLELT